jgi:hypothetical protein
MIIGNEFLQELTGNRLMRKKRVMFLENENCELFTGMRENGYYVVEMPAHIQTIKDKKKIVVWKNIRYDLSEKRKNPLKIGYRSGNPEIEKETHHVKIFLFDPFQFYFAGVYSRST